MTGDRLSAAEALQLGLVNRVVPAEEVLATAQQLAARICQNAPLAVRESIAIARQATDLSEDEAWRLSDAAAVRVMRTEDAQEGPRAFADKREPVWTGR